MTPPMTNIEAIEKRLADCEKYIPEDLVHATCHDVKLAGHYAADIGTLLGLKRKADAMLEARIGNPIAMIATRKAYRQAREEVKGV